MCDFLNDDYSNPFPISSCSPNGEYYRYSNQMSPQARGPQNLLSVGGNTGLDKYNMLQSVQSVQPSRVALSDKIQFDRHDVLMVLMFIIIIIVIKMLMSLYKLNLRIQLYMQSRPEQSYNPASQQVQQVQQPPPKPMTLEQQAEENIKNSVDM